MSWWQSLLQKGFKFSWKFGWPGEKDEPENKGSFTDNNLNNTNGEDPRKE